MYEAVKQCDIKFEKLNYEMLAVFLFLILGTSQMYKIGLQACVPRRRFTHSNAKSLAAKTNRDMSEWIVDSYKFSEQIKKEMIARLIQIETIVLMNSSCYSFGGRIYVKKKEQE